MIKSIIVIAAASLLANVALAAEVSKRQLCVVETGSYISKVAVQEPVQELVAISRQFYPNLEAMIEEDVTSREHEDALVEAGPREGCEEIEEHVQSLNNEVSCYNEVLEKDEDGLLDIARANPEAEKVIEAYFACNTAKGD